MDGIYLNCGYTLRVGTYKGRHFMITHNDIITAAELCDASYNMNDPRFTQIDELACGVFEYNGKIWIVNRGTSNARGWVDDLEVVPCIDQDGTLVHLGFWRCTNKVMPYIEYDLNELLAQIAPQSREVIIVGHSLGGAMANLEHKRLNAPAITFGEPRSHSQLGKQFVDFDHYRIVISGDPVCGIPDNVAWTHTVQPFYDLSFPEDKLDFKYHSPLTDYYIPRLRALKT